MVLVIKMKFINKEQFRNYFYNKTMENSPYIDTRVSSDARDIFAYLQTKKNIGPSSLFLIGPGNNGKLALKLAQHCAKAHIRVHIFLAQATPSTKEIAELFKQHSDYVQIYTDITSPRFISLFSSVSQIIDGLFATGVSSNLDSHYTQLIDTINSHAKKTVLSLILPSGMTDLTSNQYIHASDVLSVQYPLDTLLTHHFPIQNIHIIPSSIQQIAHKPISTITSSIPQRFSPTLEVCTQKYTRGNIFTFGGIDTFGSSIFTLKSLLKINACAIHHFGDLAGMYPLLSQIPEIEYHDIHSLPAHFKQYQYTPTCVVLGFGTQTQQFLSDHYQYLLKFPHFFPILLDSGALLLPLNDEKNETRQLHPLILTPSIDEFSHLTQLPISEIHKKRIPLAQMFAKQKNLLLVLKGDQTIVTDGSRTWINPAGNPLLATPGSGDVLTGVIAAHLDQTITNDNLFERICQAVYRHSLAADSLAEEYTNFSASMLIEAL